jgi:hypothetical protein
MRRLVLTIASAVCLSGCAGHSRLAPPIVDMNGVDPVKYNADISECTRKKENASFVGAATMISDCMADKGYRVIEKMG